MLTVLRNDFPAGSGPAVTSFAEKVGTEGEVTCLGPGLCVTPDVDTARFAEAGLGSMEPRVEGPTLELLDFATGSEGSGPVGGAIDGLDGRGSDMPDIV